MAERNKLTSQQVFEIGKHIWENRDRLQKLSPNDAHEVTMNEVSIAMTRHTFNAMSKHMHLKFMPSTTSPVKKGLALLESRLGIDFSDEAQTQQVQRQPLKPTHLQGPNL